MTSRLSISIVIPNWNGAAYLERCLGSLEVQCGQCGEILVVDNGSTDGSAEVAARVAPRATVIRLGRNMGFAAAANAGIRAAHGDWVAVLNNDTEVSPSWLRECASGIERHPEAAFLACRIMDIRARERVFSAGDCFLRAGVGYRRGQELPDRDEYGVECAVFSACGCAALYRKAVLERIGLFDERFFAYLEDVDLGLRLRAAGHCGWYLPSAVVYHHGGATSGGEFSSLAVRLRTRNAVLLLIKSLPAAILGRCAPMILAAQVSWALRALSHGRVLSYTLGLAGALRHLPAMIAGRRRLRPLWCRNSEQLWQDILASEKMARRDYDGSGRQTGNESAFLKWYFRGKS